MLVTALSESSNRLSGVPIKLLTISTTGAPSAYRGVLGGMRSTATLPPPAPSDGTKTTMGSASLAGAAAAIVHVTHVVATTQ